MFCSWLEGLPKKLKTDYWEENSFNFLTAVSGEAGCVSNHSPGVRQAWPRCFPPAAAGGLCWRGKANTQGWCRPRSPPNTLARSPRCHQGKAEAGAAEGLGAACRGGTGAGAPGSVGDKQTSCGHIYELFLKSLRRDVCSSAVPGRSWQGCAVCPHGRGSVHKELPVSPG